MSQPRVTSEQAADADGEFAQIQLTQPNVAVAVSISGTFTGTVSLQRRLDGTNWRTVQTWTAATEATYLGDVACALRLGFDTSGYGSGTATCRLQAG